MKHLHPASFGSSLNPVTKLAKFFRATLWIGVGGILGIIVTTCFFRWQSAVAIGEQKQTPKSSEASPKHQDLPSASISNKNSPRRIANEQRAAGNYILDLDMPGLANRLSDRDRKLIADVMRMRGPEYGKMFTEMGVDQKTRDQLLHNIALLYQAKLDVRKTLTQLTNAQADYNERMKAVLGPRYEEYRQYEESGMARQESTLITAFAKGSGLPEVPPDRWAQLRDIIQTNKAYSARTLGDISGPFDELQKPVRGDSAVQKYCEQSQAALALSASAVVKQAKDLGFTSQETQLLEKYYDSQINYYEQTIAEITSGAPPRSVTEKLEKMRASGK